MNNAGNIYFGEEGSADVGFPSDTWARCQQDLAAAEMVMRELAAEYGLEFLSNVTGRAIWPARRLRRKKVLQEVQVELVLNSNYLIDEQLTYTLGIQQRSRLGWLSRDQSYQEVAWYTPEEVRDQARLDREIRSILPRVL